MLKRIICLLGIIFLAGCSTAARQHKAVQSDAGDRITVGKVQREIRMGMPSAQVIEVLERQKDWYHCKMSDGTTKHVPAKLFNEDI